MIDDVIWKNKSIRNFVSQFKGEETSKVVRAALLLGIEMIKRESTTQLKTATQLEQFAINILSSSNSPPEQTQDPAGLEK